MTNQSQPQPKFSPGPWRVQEMSTGRQKISNKDGLFVCSMQLIGKEKKDEIRANAALIAAAPEMYALLERLWQLGEAAKIFPMLALEKKLFDIIEEARRILAKARGEAETCKG